MTEAIYASEVIVIEHTPYLALTGELCGVFCEDLGGYNGTALHGFGIHRNHKEAATIVLFGSDTHWNPRLCTFYISTNAGLQTNFSYKLQWNLVKIQNFSFTKRDMKIWGWGWGVGWGLGWGRCVNNGGRWVNNVHSPWTMWWQRVGPANGMASNSKYAFAMLGRCKATVNSYSETCL